MKFEFKTLIRPTTRNEQFLGNAVYQVIPTPEKSPAFLKERFKQAVVQRTWLAMGEATTLAEAELAIDRFIVRIEKAILDFGWGCLKVKISKGKTDASVLARVECWRGSAPSDGSQDNREKVLSEFLAPATAVTECSDKGYGLLSKFFVIKKLEEVAKRSHPACNYKRVPVETTICPPELLVELKKRMMEQLPTQQTLDAQTTAALLFERTLQVRSEENERAALQWRESQAKQAAQNVILRAAEVADRKKKLAAMETHTNVNAKWYKWGGTSQNRVKIEGNAEGVNVHISGARAYIVFPCGREIIVTTKNLQFQAVPTA